MSLNLLDMKLIEKTIVKDLGFIDGSLQRFSISFSPPKTYRPNKQTTWNTSHLHGVAWSIRMLDYDKFFAVFYDIKVMNAEVFAKELEQCRLWTRLLAPHVENLDVYGCPKVQDLVGEGKADSSWICSSYPFRHKTRFPCAETEAKVYGEFALQHLNL